MIVRLHISYDGTPFHGWQTQPGGVATVQGFLLEALAKMLDKNIEDVALQGASRTDAGVHALGQVASTVFDERRDVWDYVRGLNALTPKQISVNYGQLIDGRFNARHDTGGKRYEFRVWNHRFEHPLLCDRTWHYRLPLDLERMQIAAAFLVGKHNFSAFQAADCQSSTSIRDVWKVEVDRDGHEIRIVVEGSAFLKNMVRIIAGTLVEVGCGILEPDAVAKAVETGRRDHAGMTAMPQGLTLVEVFYPDHPWDISPKIGCWEPT